MSQVCKTKGDKIMATIITGIDKTKVVSNLDTYNHTALSSGMYMVSIAVTEIPPSGLTLAIKKNGSTVVSTSAPAASQQLAQLQTVLNVAANDVIGITLASSNIADTKLNVLKGILNIHRGSV